MSGLILDVYDDQAALLASTVPQDQLPDMAKTAAFLSPEERQALPAKNFALVASVDGNLFCKYATIDPGNTWMSAHYFLSQRGHLSKEAQLQVVNNLIDAHEAHQMQVPLDLVKIGLALTADGVKTAEVVDSVLATAPVMEQEKLAEADCVALGKYPLRSYEEVAAGMGFFRENMLRFHPNDRREFATKLASRAADLGIPVPSHDIEKYAGTALAPDAGMYIEARRQYVPASMHPVLDVLVKSAGDERANPEKLATALTLFDEQTGLDHLWDQHVLDPVSTCFEKTAEDFVWVEGAERVTEADLRLLSANRQLLKDHFGDDFATQFAKDPVSVFKSLPDINKVTLARLASDTGHSPVGMQTIAHG